MSLRVWLPLRGSLENLGLDEVELTNNGATVNVNGKIGSCYSFDGTDDYMSADSPDFDVKSVCFWVYPTSISATTVVFADYKSRFSFGTASSKIITACGKSGTGSSSYDYTFGIANYNLNQWNHIVMIVDPIDGYHRLWINGVEQQRLSRNNYFNHGDNVLEFGKRSTGSYFNGRLNDFRMYDHILSEKEIHDISKALIVHMPLDGTHDDGSTVYDCSGFHNDGVLQHGTLTVDPDTPRYSNSTYFDGSTYIGFGTRIRPTDEISVVHWIKPEAVKSTAISCMESGGWAFQNALINLHATVDGTNKYVGSTTVKTREHLNSWHQFAFTYDGFNFDKYVDGELVASTPTGSENKSPIKYGGSSVPLWIGAEAKSSLTNPAASSSYPNYKGYMSDVRIYATALSAEDIKELYGVGASVDNLQNMHAYWYEEEPTLSNPSITKTGIVKESELEEADKASLFDSGKITAKEIIEI